MIKKRRIRGSRNIFLRQGGRIMKKVEKHCYRGRTGQSILVLIRKQVASKNTTETRNTMKHYNALLEDHKS